jgi:hypothetical protein
MICYRQREFEIILAVPPEEFSFSWRSSLYKKEMSPKEISQKHYDDINVIISIPISFWKSLPVFLTATVSFQIFFQIRNFSRS